MKQVQASCIDGSPRGKAILSQYHTSWWGRGHYVIADRYREVAYIPLDNVIRARRAYGFAYSELFGRAAAALKGLI